MGCAQSTPKGGPPPVGLSEPSVSTKPLAADLPAVAAAPAAPAAAEEAKRDDQQDDAGTGPSNPAQESEEEKILIPVTSTTTTASTPVPPGSPQQAETPQSARAATPTAATPTAAAASPLHKTLVQQQPSPRTPLNNNNGSSGGSPKSVGSAPSPSKSTQDAKKRSSQGDSPTQRGSPLRPPANSGAFNGSPPLNPNSREPVLSRSASLSQPGALEAKYALGQRIGSGHYAQVFRAQNRETGEHVAVKRIQKRLSRDERLTLEIDLMRRAGSHPNIVRLYDVFESEKELDLVMELVQGGELFEYLVEHGPYSEADAAHHIRDVTSAIAFLHAQNIVHRDLKPENLLLTSKDERTAKIKVADFGLAKVMATDVTRTVCGTWAYAAPEVKKPQSGYDSKCDVWSIGVICFVLLSAFHPFDPNGDLSDAEIWTRISTGGYDFNDPAWNGVSSTAKDFIAKILVMNPKDRPTAEELLSHPWLNPHPVAAETPLSPAINTRLATFTEKAKSTRGNPFAKAARDLLNKASGRSPTTTPTKSPVAQQHAATQAAIQAQHHPVVTIAEPPVPSSNGAAPPAKVHRVQFKSTSSNPEELSPRTQDESEGEPEEEEDVFDADQEEEDEGRPDESLAPPKKSAEMARQRQRDDGRVQRRNALVPPPTLPVRVSTDEEGLAEQLEMAEEDEEEDEEEEAREVETDEEVRLADG